jgi:hypothetical protein
LDVINAFERLNASSILDVINALKTARTEVTTLEIELKDVRHQFNIDVQEAFSAAKSLKSSKIRGSLHAQIEKMNEDF